MRKRAQNTSKDFWLGRNESPNRASAGCTRVALENLKPFDEFLARRFPGSRTKAYYMMSIHEHLPPQARKDLQKVGWTQGLDRKSTRLNSSHLGISYAVFCLKKKKKK